MCDSNPRAAALLLRICFSFCLLVCLLLFKTLMHAMGQAESLDDYNRLHSYPMETPDSVYDFQDDDAFARDRLQGKDAQMQHLGISQ